MAPGLLAASAHIKKEQGYVHCGFNIADHVRQHTQLATWFKRGGLFFLGKQQLGFVAFILNMGVDVGVVFNVQWCWSFIAWWSSRPNGALFQEWLLYACAHWSCAIVVKVSSICRWASLVRSAVWTSLQALSSYWSSREAERCRRRRKAADDYSESEVIPSNREPSQS